MRKTILAMSLMLISVSAFSQHTIIMKSGEKMYGKVQSLNNGVINFDFKGNMMKLNVTDVTSIVFSESGDNAKLSAAEPLKKEPGEKQVMSGSYLVRYKVADRTVSRPPRVDNLTQEKGTVVIDISIDKYGHVMKAIPGGKGSTTTSEYLLTKAKQAAESSQFDNVPTAPLEQKGYMIITF
jgi:hypothetical protein